MFLFWYFSLLLAGARWLPLPPFPPGTPLLRWVFSFSAAVKFFSGHDISFGALREQWCFCPASCRFYGGLRWSFLRADGGRWSFLLADGGYVAVFLFLVRFGWRVLRGRGRSGFSCCSLPHFVPLLPFWVDRSCCPFFRCMFAWFSGAFSAPYSWVALSGGQY